MDNDWEEYFGGFIPGKPPLFAVDKTTEEPVKLGSIITSFRGERAKLISCERVNELRYGGRRSGKVFVEWIDRNPGFKAEYYDNVFNLIVIDTDLEHPTPL